MTPLHTHSWQVHAAIDHTGRDTVDASAHVAEGEGYFERADGFAMRWRVRCITCTAKAKHARGDSLTPPQLQALHAATNPNNTRRACAVTGSEDGESL